MKHDIRGTGMGSGVWRCKRCEHEVPANSDEEMWGECNPMPKESTWEEKDSLDALVRDFTAVGFMAKSEAKRRLEALIASAVTEERERIAEKVREMTSDSEYENPRDQALGGILTLLERKETTSSND